MKLSISNGVVHQCNEPTPPPMRPVLTEDRIARKRFSAIEIWQSGRGGELGFLDACYEDLVIDEELIKLRLGVQDAVGIELLTSYY